MSSGFGQQLTALLTWEDDEGIPFPNPIAQSKMQIEASRVNMNPRIVEPDQTIACLSIEHIDAEFEVDKNDAAVRYKIRNLGAQTSSYPRQNVGDKSIVISSTDPMNHRATSQSLARDTSRAPSRTNATISVERRVQAVTTVDNSRTEDEDDTPTVSLGRGLTVERATSEWSTNSSAWAFTDTTRVDDEITSLRQTIGQVAEHVDLMNKTSASNQHQVAGVMNSLRAVMTRINATENIAKDFEAAYGQSAAECRDGIDAMRTGLMNNSRSIQQVVEFTNDMEARLARNVQGMEGDIHGSIARVRETIEDVREAANETKEAEAQNRTVLQELS